MPCSTEHVGGHSEDFIVSLVHGVGVIPVVFDAIPNNDGASLRICFDEGLHCAADPSVCWQVFCSFLVQEGLPKKASRECGFIFDKDWVVPDLVRWGFRVLQEVEAHLFFHLGDFDAACLFC